MKMVLSALIALAFIAGVARPSFATKKVFEKLDKEGRGGHQT